jgi:hypothetical protein
MRWENYFYFLKFLHFGFKVWMKEEARRGEKGKKG